MRINVATLIALITLSTAGAVVPAGKATTVSGQSAFAPPQPSRSVFLNGIDISSARGEEMKNVSVLINEQGDIFITAPHYQVNEEDSYVTLSKYVQTLGTSPEHKAMQPTGTANTPMQNQHSIPAMPTAPVAATPPAAMQGEEGNPTATTGQVSQAVGSQTPGVGAGTNAEAEQALQEKPGVKLDTDTAP